MTKFTYGKYVVVYLFAETLTFFPQNGGEKVYFLPECRMKSPFCLRVSTDALLVCKDVLPECTDLQPEWRCAGKTWETTTNIYIKTKSRTA